MNVDENINVTIVETKCKLKRKLTDTQKEFVSTCNTDKLLKSIEIANEINPESYTFGYVKDIYNNDKNFIERLCFRLVLIMEHIKLDKRLVYPVYFLT